METSGSLLARPGVGDVRAEVGTMRKMAVRTAVASAVIAPVMAFGVVPLRRYRP